MNPQQLIDDIINEKIPGKEEVIAQKRKEFTAREIDKENKSRLLATPEGLRYITYLREQHEKTKLQLTTDALNVEIPAEVIRAQAIKFALLSKMMEEYYERD